MELCTRVHVLSKLIIIISAAFSDILFRFHFSPVWFDLCLGLIWHGSILIEPDCNVCT